MKKKNAMLVFLMPSLIITLLLASCQKEAIYTGTLDEEIATASNHGPVTRAYRDSFAASFVFVPDIAAGWTFPNAAPAWYHGSGVGNATHMGNVKGFFNTYTLRNPAGGVMIYNRSVTDFYASQLKSYNVPSNVHAVVYNEKGNSVWFQIPSEGWISEVISPTRINYYGTSLIVGGTGKFAGATGETFFQGYFNPQNLEGTFWRYGSIAY